MRCMSLDRPRAKAALAAFLMAVIAAALAPLFGRAGDSAVAANANFPGWPITYEGRALTELPLTAREAAFVQDFPGRVGRFSDGRREIIIRWVGAPTRRLHPAADCFRGSGYSIAPMPVRKDAAGAAMSCFRASQSRASQSRASNGADTLMVCELIRDQRGETWPDVSAWYWSGMLGTSAAPWWSFVVAERD
jgi:hypothetical protein